MGCGEMWRITKFCGTLLYVQQEGQKQIRLKKRITRQITAGTSHDGDQEEREREQEGKQNAAVIAAAE